MDSQEWQEYKEHLISTYQPEKIMFNTDIKSDRGLFAFKLGGYGFRFTIGFVTETFPNKIARIRGYVNAQYCFLHIGEWRDMKSNDEINMKLALARRDADNDDRFEDRDEIKIRWKRRAKRIEKKIVFKRK